MVDCVSLPRISLISLCVTGNAHDSFDFRSRQMFVLLSFSHQEPR